MQITRAADGKEAVKIFAENPPDTFDMVFMDIMMPKMNGYEATRNSAVLMTVPTDEQFPLLQ